eukprot:4405506-Alexandrium_andersonii.AAC.1
MAHEGVPLGPGMDLGRSLGAHQPRDPSLREAPPAARGVAAPPVVPAAQLPYAQGRSCGKRSGGRLPAPSLQDHLQVHALGRQPRARRHR